MGGGFGVVDGGEGGEEVGEFAGVEEEIGVAGAAGEGALGGGEGFVEQPAAGAQQAGDFGGQRAEQEVEDEHCAEALRGEGDAVGGFHIGAHGLHGDLRGAGVGAKLGEGGGVAVQADDGAAGAGGGEGVAARAAGEVENGAGGGAKAR